LGDSDPRLYSTGDESITVIIRLDNCRRERFRAKVGGRSIRKGFVLRRGMEHLKPSKSCFAKKSEASKLGPLSPLVMKFLI